MTTQPLPLEMTPINLAEKFALFSDVWSPKVVAALNGQHVKLVKLRGSRERDPA